MSTTLSLPGTPHQKILLQAIVSCYRDDDRILSVILFGSLGRDNWGAYSDLDLAVIVRDDITLEVAAEVDRVCTFLAEYGEQTLFTEVADRDGYLVMESLSGIALSYCPLAAISPYVLEGRRVLVGSLDAEVISAAARANAHPEPPLSQQVHRALWLALGVDIIVQRRKFWQAQLGLERLRGALVEIFAASRGGKRAYQVFEEQASVELKAKFGHTFPQVYPASPADTLQSLGAALLALLQLIEHDLDELSNGQVQLGSGEREMIGRLQARLT